MMLILRKYTRRNVNFIEENKLHCEPHFTPSFKLLNISTRYLYIFSNSYGFTLENDQRHVAHNVARSKDRGIGSTSTLTSC